jgi:hypothetical protein
MLHASGSPQQSRDPPHTWPEDPQDAPQQHCPAVQLSPTPQVLLHAPQCSRTPPDITPVASVTSQPLPGSVSQSAKPARHVKPQVPLLHVAIEPAGIGHGEQLVPHVATDVLLTHVPLQSW